MEKNGGSINRRTFLKGATVVGVTALGTTTLAACSANQPQTRSDDTLADSSVSFEVAPKAIPDNEITETVEAEVIVVGSGPSGLITALSAIENGLDVVMVTQSENVVARGGSNAVVNSKYLEERNLERIKPDFILAQIVQASYNVDVNKWYKWYNNSEEAVNWLIDKTANTDLTLSIEQGNIYDENSPLYGPLGSHCWNNDEYPIVADGQPALVLEIRKQLEENNVRIDFNTRAEQLVRGGIANGTEGRVDGVIAVNADGKYVKYQGSKAVVLATGDFSGNREMMEKYAPEAVAWVQNWDMATSPDVLAKVYGGLYTGQGHKMGLWVGAAWQKTIPNAVMAGGFGPNSNPWNAPSTLMVDDKGERFCNEEMGGGHLPNLMQHVGPVNAIFDSQYPAAHQPWNNQKSKLNEGSSTPEKVIEKWDSQVESGAMFRADTIEELAGQLGIDPSKTKETVNRYNTHCEKGNDLDFYKRAELLTPITTAPFYGWRKEEPTFLTVTGGLRTNINMQVCNEADEAIEGLYNVGTMIGDCYANCYNFLVEGHNHGMNCITFGYLTGKYIAENE